MTRRKPVFGVCKLCFLKQMLNYEHVPPKSAFNKNTRYRINNFGDYLNGIESTLVKQGGIGFYSYCEKCNNELGNKYVNAYKDFVELGAYIN